MLGKLMKYEWRGLRFPLLIMLGILVGTTLLTCLIIFTINPKMDDVTAGLTTMSLILCILLYYFGIIGCSIGTMLIIAIRFYKTTYTDQGYLTHTLPVSSATLLAAKTITAVLCYLAILGGVAATILVIIGAIFLQVSKVSGYQRDYIYRMFAETVSEISMGFREEYGISLGGFIAFYAIFMVIACVSAIMIVLGCVSLGQLYTKHRIIGAIIAYFAIICIQQFVSYLAMLPTYAKMMRAEALSETIPIFEVISPTMIISLLWAVAVSVIMHIINLHMMTKRLNLE